MAQMSTLLVGEGEVSPLRRAEAVLTEGLLHL